MQFVGMHAVDPDGAVGQMQGHLLGVLLKHLLGPLVTGTTGTEGRMRRRPVDHAGRRAGENDGAVVARLPCETATVFITPTQIDVGRVDEILGVRRCGPSSA